jgi:eukaryotic-like serine/threonine-protein kinase
MIFSAMRQGTQIGHYEVLALIGKGGMGEVWKARDSKLHREVAIKMIPDEFVKDGDRLSRFEREARLLASLNHPHIATIHGLEESGNTRFLVLELIDGETLADRLRSGPIPEVESLQIALQIAQALESAHEKGVIHRDLKPANVKINSEGRAKVLDFGLAKIQETYPDSQSLSNSPTLSALQTAAGLILGTAAYMSPEQARGKNVDRRADVWAFGCVLYEMLTGRQTFLNDETVSDTIAAILKAEPDWKALPQRTSPRIRMLLERCLRKDPRRRLPDIGAARLEIEEALNTPKPSMPMPATRSQIRYLVVVSVPALLLATLVAGWFLTRREPKSRFRISGHCCSKTTLNRCDSQIRPLLKATLGFHQMDVGSHTTLPSPGSTKCTSNLFRYRERDNKYRRKAAPFRAGVWTEPSFFI